MIALFAFNALVLGDGLDFYGKYPWWDSFLHFHSGIILSFVALWFIHIMMAEKSKFIYMNKYFTCLFLVIFSLGVGAFWEILDTNLKNKYGVAPVHTLSELQLLQSRFPQNIKLYLAYKDDIALGGSFTICYQTSCPYTIYIS